MGCLAASVTAGSGWVSLLEVVGGLHAPERCAGRTLRRSRTSVRAAISWSEGRA